MSAEAAEDTQEVEATTEEVDTSPTENAVDAVGKLLSDKDDDAENDTGEDEQDIDIDGEDDEVDEPSEDEPTTADEEDSEDGAAPTFDDSLLDRAHKAGLTISEAKAFGSPEALEQGLNLLEKQSVPDGGEDAEVEGDSDNELGLKRLDPDEYDEDVIQIVDSQNDVIRKQHEELKGLKEQIQAQEDNMRMFQEEQYYEKVDDAFEGMTGWADIIGKGRQSDMVDGSQELKNRIAILEEMAVLGRADAEAGRQTPIKKQLEKAANLVFSEHSAKVERARIKASVKRRDKSKVNRPNADRDTLLDPNDRAMEAVRRKLDGLGS